MLDYRKAADRLNGILFTHPEVNEYSYKYSEPGESAKLPALGVVLTRVTRKRGFELPLATDYRYFNQSKSFVREHVYRKVSPEMQAFLDVFLLDYQDPIWDEGLLISPEELGRRVVLWENFLARYPTFFKADYAMAEAASLVAVLILDDIAFEPHFSQEDSMLLPEFRKGLEYVLAEAPETASGRQVAEFYELLERNDFKDRTDVRLYLEVYQEERNKSWQNKESVK